MSVKQWFERKFLQWQLDNGRDSVENFAKHLGISQPYLTQLMSGKRTGLSIGTTYMICRRLNDYSLLDILGYAYPEDNIPPEIAGALKAAQGEMSTQLHGLDMDDPATRELAIQILEKHGFKYKG